MSAEATTSCDLVAQLGALYPGFDWPVREVPRWAVSSRVSNPWRMSRRGVKERYGRVRPPPISMSFPC
jgi:hypothetical protein